MTAKVLIIGVGDMARQIALGLAASGLVRELVLANRNLQRGTLVAGLVSSSYPVIATFHTVDGTDQHAVEQLITATEPDLILQNASLMGPFDLVGRKDRVAQAFSMLGRGPLLPVQLPVLMSVMAAVQKIGYGGPVANLSLPDITNPILHRIGLTPTIGLGNAEMLRRRIHSRLLLQTGCDAKALPLVRVIAHHGQMGQAMTSDAPDDRDDWVRVYLGESGERADELTYQSPALPTGGHFNIITSAAAVPVLLALLPGGAPLRTSAPGPLGLPGGFPVTVSANNVELDLPPGVDLDEAIVFQNRMAGHDGIRDIADDGTVTFTNTVIETLSVINPELAAPLHPYDCDSRWSLIRTALERSN